MCTPACSLLLAAHPASLPPVCPARSSRPGGQGASRLLRAWISWMSGHLKAEPCILLSGRLLRAPQPVRPLGFVFLRAGPGLFPTRQPLQGWHWAELRAEVLEACSGLVLVAREFPRGRPAGLCRCPSAQGLAGAEPSNSGERPGLLAPAQPRHLHTLCPRCRLTATGPQGRARGRPALKDDAAQRAGVTVLGRLLVRGGAGTPPAPIPPPALPLHPLSGGGSGTCCGPDSAGVPT